MINRLPLFLALILTAGMASGQVVVNPDGTHSTVVGSVVVNPDGTHSTIHGSVVVNPNGTHSTIIDNTIVTPIPRLSTNAAPGTENNFNTTFGTRTSTGPFQLTSGGFINRKNKKLDYIILQFPDKAKDELYTQALVYFQNSYGNPGDVVTAVEGKSITVHTTDNQIPVEGYINKFTFDYSLTISFEDNRLIVESPVINSITRLRSKNRVTTVGISGDQYDKTVFFPDGRIRLIDTGNVLDKVVNSFIEELGRNIKHSKW